MMPLLTAAFVISNRTVWERAHACIQNLPVRLAVGAGHGGARTTLPRWTPCSTASSGIAWTWCWWRRTGLRCRSKSLFAASEHRRAIGSVRCSARCLAGTYSGSLAAVQARTNTLYPPTGRYAARCAPETLSAARSKGGSDHPPTRSARHSGFLSARGRLRRYNYCRFM